VKCRVSTISVNLQTKDVYMITRNRDASGCSNMPIPALPRPRISRLVEGFRYTQERNAERNKDIQQIYAKRMQPVLRAIRAK
jgi:hypothetical protein